MGHGEEVFEQLNPASMDCLPDDLLVQILFFLPTKQAASTSLLSKRWRTLFTFSQYIDFKTSIFLHPEDGKSYRIDIQKSFEDFVDRTLAFQGGNHMKKFSLKFIERFRDWGDMVDVDRWIRNALEHSLSELHLCIDHLSSRYSLQRDFPSKVFPSTTLVKLSLGTGFFIPSVPSDTFLPALKVLLLDSIMFVGNQFSDVFLAACPAFEDLTIHQTCYPQFPNVISSKTIKKLSVTYSFRWCYVDYHGLISLDTPSVVDLYFSDYPRKKAPHCDFDSLAKATLDLQFAEVNNQLGPVDGDVMDLISGIRNVKTLHLTFSAVEGLDRYTFRERRFVGIRIPSINQIKTLHIRQYQGNATELKHISHILLNMEWLEVVKVYVAATMDDPKKMQLTEDLLKLPTSSSNLDIQVM